MLSDVGLSDFAEARAADLPYGRKRTLEIATTLALEPKMLLLDEPTLGMGIDDVDRIKTPDPQDRRGRTILMVEHNMSVVSDICGTITVLQRGEVLTEGSYDEVAANPAVRAAYMGGAMAEAAAPLVIRGLNGWYAESHVLHGIDLHIRAGECVTLLGRNGAGRTSTLKSILGLIGRRTGSILVHGRETVHMPPHKIARPGHRLLPEERGHLQDSDHHGKSHLCCRASPPAACRWTRSRHVPQSGGTRGQLWRAIVRRRAGR